MIGVVVWSNAAKEKAVVWCEDQASLAYLQGRVDFLDAEAWPQPGDLVELDSEMIGNLRHARRVSVLREQACPQLPDLLGNAAQPKERREPHLRLVSVSDRREPAAEPVGHSARVTPLPIRASAGR